MTRAVKQQLKALLSEAEELVLSPAVLLELLRGPQGEQVAEERESLTTAMTTLAADAKTFELAAAAMERLALYAPEAHRLPVADLVTAALAHQYECGVAHVDGDYEQIAEHGGLTTGTVGLLSAPGDVGSIRSPADSAPSSESLLSFCTRSPQGTRRHSWNASCRKCAKPQPLPEVAERPRARQLAGRPRR